MMTTPFETQTAGFMQSSGLPLSALKTVPDIPYIIRQSPLMQRGGFDIFSGIVDESIKNKMLSEAYKQQSVMTESFVTKIDEEEIRGGSPRRRFLSSAGGEFQRGFYHSKWLIDFLRSITSQTIHPTGEYGTFSYYCRTGDFLEIHRDISTCDVAVITCLKNTFGTDKSGGKLCLYPSRTKELLSEIRETPENGAVKYFLEEGQTLVMYGGILPHALLPVAENQTRIVSVLCYQAF